MYACIMYLDLITQDMMFLMYILSCVNAVLLFDDDDDDDDLQTEHILMNLNQQLSHFMLMLPYWQCTSNLYTLMDMPQNLPLQQQDLYTDVIRTPLVLLTVV